MALDFDKMNGLVPAIIQDAHTKNVLMLGFMNEDAYRTTVETGKVTFFSRTKQRLWTKGETSGNFLHVVSIESDCDNDTLLIKVEPEGPVCHRGTATCFGGDNEWALDVVLGNEINHQQQRNWRYEGTGFAFYGMPTISNATSFSSQEATYAERMIGVFGSANLSWKDMLYLSVTGRNDWLSSMPRGARSFFYPSVSLSWIFTQLPVFNNNSVLSLGKIRTSFAQVGQAGGYMDNFFYTPSYGSGMYMGYPLLYPYNGVTTFVPYFIAYDENLKPQNTKNVEAGIDLSFFNDRLRLDYTYSYQDVTDQIMQVPQAGSSGYQYMLTNGGQIKTNSHEINLSATIYENKDWTVDFGASFTKIHNYVAKLANGVESIMLTGYQTPQIRAEVGSTYPIIYGIGFARDPEGRIILNPDNGYAPQATAGDINLGECSPDFNMGFNLNVRYKRVSLATTWSWQHGGKMYHGTLGVMDTFGATKRTAEARDNGGVPVNYGKVDAKTYYQGIAGYGAYYAYSATNVRLQELSLGYTLPAKWFRDKVRMTVSFVGRNLWMIYCKAPFDPEVTASTTNNYYQSYDYFMLPSTRNLGFSVKLQF